MASPGVEVIPINVALGERLGNALARSLALIRLHSMSASARWVARGNVAFGLTNSLIANFKLLWVGRLDGAIQIGSGYLTFHPNTVTFEDATVAQAVFHKRDIWAIAPSGVTQARLRQQRRVPSSAGLLHRDRVGCDSVS